MTAYSYRLIFTWDGVNPTEETTRLISWSVDRGRDNPFVSIEAGKLVLTLDNRDGRFDPWNTSSPIYPDVTPGKGVSLAIGSTTEELEECSMLFTGYIEDVIPSGRAGERTVQVVCYDAFRMNRDALVVGDEQISLTENKTLIGNVLGAYFDWLSGVWNKDVSTLVGSTSYFYPIGGAGLSCRAIIESELGYFFESSSGFFTGQGRDYNGWPWTLELDDSDLVDISVNQPWENIVNRVYVTAHVPVLADDASLVYSLAEPLFIRAGDVHTVYARYTDENGAECNATDFEAMIPGTDYKANSSSDGLGTNLTANLVMASHDCPGYTRFTLTNSGSTDFYVTLLQRYGKVITYNKVTVSREDADSIEQYGGHELSFDYPYCQSAATAMDYAYAIVSFWKDPQKTPVLRLRHKIEDLRGIIGYLDDPGTDYPIYDLVDLFQLVHLDSDSYSVDEYFLVGKIRMWSGDNLQDVWTELKLEPYDNRRFWELGTTGYTELGDTTVLGF